MSTISRRWAGVALIALVAAGWPLELTPAAAATAQYDCYPGQILATGALCPNPSAPVAEPPPHDGHSSSAAPWIIGGLIALGIAAVVHAQSSDPTNPDSLRKNGPHLRSGLPAGLFQVDGFIADGWPIVLDYESKSGAVLSVITGGGIVWQQRLLPGRHQIAYTYSNSQASGPIVGLFSVQSLEPTGVSQDEPPPVSVYAIGAGKTALAQVAMNGADARGRLRLDARAAYQPLAIQRLVYSPSEPPRRIAIQSDAQAGISRLTFGPASLSPPAQATFSYYRDQVFEQVREDILLYTWDWKKHSNGVNELVINSQSIWHEASTTPKPMGPSGNLKWNGRNEHGGISKGWHRLQVRAWQSQHDPDWVSMLSDQLVSVPS